jgi:mono/diheme cytochrome c family protein
MMHDPPPADLTDAGHMNTLTDGHIFYQISEGRKPMPSFKKRLTQDQRWQLVLLVRSLSQPATPSDMKPSAPASSKPDANTKPVRSSKK